MMGDNFILYLSNNFDQCYHISEVYDYPRHSLHIYLEDQIQERISWENDHSVFYNMVLYSNFEVKLMTLIS